MAEFLQALSLTQAVQRLAQGPARLLAGGTDLYPGAGATLAGDVVDLTAIAGLRGIVHDEAGLRIGACTTWSDIAEADLPPALAATLAALQQAALQVGGRQIQNAGTLGGNLCNASPAADGVPPLLAVDAQVELVGPQGTRHLPLSGFLLGPRRTARHPSEVLSAILIPAAALQGRSAFVKLGARAHLVISIAMVAARVVVQAGHAADVAIAVGSCSATARRVPSVEAALRGQPLANLAGGVHDADVAAALDPIDDVRATGAYRAQAAAELIRRALGQCLTGGAA